MAGLTFGRYVIVGVLLILVIIFLPKGLVDLPNQLQQWWKHYKKPKPEQVPVQE
jgi:branched-chain amino acid transport system permease protein